MTRMTTPMETTSGFVAWLYGLVEDGDRARLAALRRGLLLEPAQLYELLRVVPPAFLEGVSQAEVERRLTVGVLFAVHPRSFPPMSGRRRNMGASLRLFAERRGVRDAQGGMELPDPVKHRLNVLLSAHPEHLFDHLHQVVRLLKSAEIPVDWEQLLRDLRQWDRPDRRIQWDWSRSFYVGDRGPEQPEQGGATDVS